MATHCSIFARFLHMQPFSQQTYWGDKWHAHSSFKQGDSYSTAQYVHREPLQSYYLQLCEKTGACVAFAGAAAEYGASCIQCQAFVCFFDLLLTTAPPNMCGGEPTPPPLNTFPHINKPCHCRNAWGPVLSLLLEFSPLIRWLLGVLSRYSRLKRLADPTLIASTCADPLVSVHTQAIVEWPTMWLRR